MTVAKFDQPNFLTQSASVYKANIDAAIAVLQSIGADFAPHAMDAPNMQVVIDAGRIFKPGGTMVSAAQQITGSLIAPVTNPRIDRLVVDSENGVYSVLTGTESASPTAPSIPNGKLPVAQISMTVGQTTIANSIITDERTTYGPLAKLMRMPVEAVSSTTGGFIREILLADRGILFDCDCSNGPITIMLPDTAGAGNGFMIGVVKTDATANEIIFVPSTTGEVFSDGSATKSVAAQNGTMIVTTDGLGQWYAAFDSSRTYNNVTLTGTTTAGAINAGAISGSTGVFSGLLTVTAGQIKFPATQVPSADANTLDDYEEGAWTPSLGGTATYSVQVGTYTKIGRLVVFSWRLVISTIGTGSTTVVSGLPFTSGGSGSSLHFPAVQADDTSATAIVSVTSYIAGASSSLALRSRIAASASDGTSAIFGSASGVGGSGHYYI